MDIVAPRSHASLPPFMLGLALISWGILCEHIFLGIVLATAAELPRFVAFRFELSSENFYRIADTTSVFFAALAIYQFNEHSIYGIYYILTLLPVCIYPLLVARRYSTLGAIPMSALFMSLRRRIRSGAEQESLVDVELPYLLIVVLAASANNFPPVLYVAGAAIFVFAALFSGRVQRFSLAAWTSSAVAVVLLAMALQFGIRATQEKLHDGFSYWINQFAWTQTDPRRATTAIGQIGRLKLSDRIRVRVHAALSMPLPLVLHEASYSTFTFGSWSASPDANFASVDPLPETTTWVLAKPTTADDSRRAKIVVAHPEDVGVVPLPYEVSQLTGEEVIEVQRNHYGTTMLEAYPGQLAYNVALGATSDVQAPPRAEDRSVPKDYRRLMEQIATEIELPQNEPALALQKVKAFFSNNFKYSLIQKGYYPGRKPLGQFLLDDRNGHCEFFATATALLLRQAGIPTRYAVGYMVYEHSSLENAFVARARHAHAWVEAYINGAWVFVDTTPGGWNALESANRPAWQTIQDAWSWLSNRFQRYQRGDSDSIFDSLVWLLVPLIALLIWRLRGQLRRYPRDNDSSPARKPAPGYDSELIDLCQDLDARGYAINPGDTISAFFYRHIKEDEIRAQIAALIVLHNRHRFSPQALSDGEREGLRAGCAQLRQKLNDYLLDVKDTATFN